MATDDQVRINEIKLLILGEGGAGKTSLTRRLIDGTYSSDEPQTNGIAIRDWDIQLDERQIQAHVWDFGGQ